MECLESGTGWVRGEVTDTKSMGTKYNHWGLGRGVQGRRARETDGQINIRRLMPKNLY